LMRMENIDVFGNEFICLKEKVSFWDAVYKRERECCTHARAHTQ
jgi:hypothetical protein